MSVDRYQLRERYAGGRENEQLGTRSIRWQVEECWAEEYTVACSSWVPLGVCACSEWAPAHCGRLSACAPAQRVRLLSISAAPAPAQRGHLSAYAPAQHGALAQRGQRNHCFQEQVLDPSGHY